MNIKRFYILLALLLLIVSLGAFFYNKEQNKASNIESITFEEKPIMNPIYHKLERRMEYLQKMEEVNSMGGELWAKSFKQVNEEYADVADKYTTLYDTYSSSDIDLLFRVVQAEIGNGYSFNQKANVASVIFNRVKDRIFGGSLRAVLNGNQFSTISNGAIYRVNIEEKTIAACEYAFMMGDTTNGALFFHSGQPRSSFSGRSFKYNDGAHNFY